MPGFLPNSRGSLILDLIVVAMALIVPVLFLSFITVRFKKNIKLHRTLQIGLGTILGLAVVAFEIDMRLSGWRHLAEPSPYYDSLVFPALTLHLGFAIPTLILWCYTITTALRHSIDSQRNKARMNHRKLGLWSTGMMLGTAVTGWIFYTLAFVAT